MDKRFTAKVSVLIQAPSSAIWEALTSPDMISKYLHGTKVESKWKEGSTLIFRGEWKGKSYVDKGIIKKMEKGKLFRYTWFSSFSGLPDLPENYSMVSYELSPKQNSTRLTVTQDNIPSEESKQGSEKNWSAVLQTLKNLVEQKSDNAQFSEKI
ncbi:MAG: SRPBCC family protein [Flavisolibacter sp.]|jgi:uncharacterized protein YndB with AHSA1/START domain